MASGTQELETSRLLLRQWRDADLLPFAAMNADSAVMRYYQALLTREESDAMVGRIRAGFDAHGFGFWAVEIKGIADFAGYVGLAVPAWMSSFTPCVEIGWRIAAEHWNKGYATEGAAAVLNAAFNSFGLKQIVSFAVPDNLPSRRVMEKLGMRRDPAEDFDHPRLPEGHRLRRHVLYRLDRDDWLGGPGS